MVSPPSCWPIASLRIVPITDEDAHELVRSLRGSPLLFGYRGRPAVDVDALEDLLLRVGLSRRRAARDRRDGPEPGASSAPSGVVAVDVKIHVAPAPARLPADFRRMRL